MRWLGAALVFGVAMFCVLLLTVRFVAFPRIEAYRDDIAGWLSREIGQPVEIDRIVTGWDGWNPQIAVHGLRMLDRDPTASQLPFELPEVTGTISWTSILLADLRLRELQIVGPRLAVRRDANGRVHVGGLEVDAEHAPGESAFTDWLLRQQLIVVKNALVTWNDDRRKAPQLVLDNVDFRLENRNAKHLFGLTGTPPPEVAAPIELRGELDAASLADWRNGAGRLYLRLDYADVAVWSEWLPLPVSVTSGQGAMRVWFEFDSGIAREVVADVELADVRTRLGNELPTLDLAQLSGRISWRQEGDRRALTARSLAIGMRDGTRVVPGNVDVHYGVAANGTLDNGRAAVDRLDLAPLTTLAAHVPLPRSLRDDLARFGARGTLTNAEFSWEGSLETPASYKTRATFADLGVNARDSMPGLAGASGSFEATEAGGALRLASKRLLVSLPKVFGEPLVFDSAAARVRWERNGERLFVWLDEVDFANAHASGNAQGTWQSRASGPGEIDLTAHVTRVDARQLHRYVPLMIGSRTRTWLRDALIAGRSDDARLTLKGDLARFPFGDGKSGTFVVAVRASDATLVYAPGWPQISGIDAEVRFEGHGMRLVASQGMLLGAAIGRTTATIDDMSLDHPLLRVEGEASAPTSEFLRFIRESPVAEWSDHVADGAIANGDGKLALQFAFALGDNSKPALVKGDYQFVDNGLRLAGVPPLAKVNGLVSFTEREVSGRDIAFEALGGGGRVAFTSKDGTLRVNGEGTASMESVRQEFPAPLLDRVNGKTDWRLQLSTRKAVTSWTVGSTLRGASVDLPVPFAKRPDDETHFRVERKPPASERARETFVVDYGAARIVAQRRGNESVDRALMLFGKAASARAAAEPELPGIVIRGDLQSVNLDDWLRFAKASTGESNSGARALEVQHIDVAAGEAIAFGRRVDTLVLAAQRANDAWRMTLSSRQLQGKATWEPAGSKLANGRLVAHLTRLELAKLEEVGTQAETTPRSAGSANPWPEIEVTAEHYIARSGDLGRLELLARPEGTDWRVARFALVNDAGRIDADGWWRLVGNRHETLFDVKMDVNDSAAYLARMGLPADVKAAPAKLDGKLEWPGSPADFEYSSLSGTFKVAVGAGQFTKLDPGVGKLLGVLSLQALPRRISLDFRDVFSEGFAFDSINGSVRIANGMMHSDDLMLSGPAAKVRLVGEVDLARETQKLSVRVQPSLSTVVSTGAGAAAVALLAANPLVGAAVGAGTLIAQKIMQDPIEQIFSYEYSVRGSWSEPLVERVAGRPFVGLGKPREGEAATR
ncbi:MAG TPA: YhdP family protein [Casimicrobiaceae bacterium]|nr:YhdP family protein [Casimicrobiaceae bacterium]